MRFIKLFEEYLTSEEKKAKKLRFFYRKSDDGCILIDKSKLNDFDIPIPIKDEMIKWDVIYKSPHSNSFYSSDEFKINSETGTVSVGKPDGLLRVSDHWNYTSFRDDHKYKHSRTDTHVENNTHVTLAKYDKSSKEFKVLISLPSDTYIKQEAEKKRIHQHLTDPSTIAKKKDFKSKINNNEIYVSFGDINGIVSKWSGRDLRIKNDSGDIIFNTKDIREFDDIPKFYINNTEIEDPFKYE